MKKIWSNAFYSFLLLIHLSHWGHVMPKFSIKLSFTDNGDRVGVVLSWFSFLCRTTFSLEPLSSPYCHGKTTEDSHAVGANSLLSKCLSLTTDIKAPSTRRLKELPTVYHLVVAAWQAWVREIIDESRESKVTEGAVSWSITYQRLL